MLYISYVFIVILYPSFDSFPLHFLIVIVAAITHAIKTMMMMLKVVKSDVVRTSSNASSASSGSRAGGGSVSVRRASQPRDTAPVRPRSMHVTGPLPISGPLTERRGSASSAKTSLTSKTSRETPQTTSATQRPRSSLHSRQGPKPASSLANGRIKPEDRINPGGESSAASGGGIPGGGKVVGQRQFLGRSDSAKLSRAKTVSEQHKTLRSKENLETTDQQIEASVGMKSASSTPDLHTTVDKDSPSTTSHSVRQPTKVPTSGVSRYIQRDLANRHLPVSSKTSTTQRTTFTTRQPLSARGGAVTGGGLVSPSVQARSEGVPSDRLTAVALTRYTQHKSAANHIVSAKLSATPTELQTKSKPIVKVSHSSSSSPTTFFTLTLAKSEIDKANKDVQHKVYSSDFKVCDHFTWQNLFN